jgi:GGDEF domain-containing protein
MAAVIKLVASRYKLAERVFRYGGDEFVILCPVHLAEEVRDTIEAMYAPFILPDGTAVSISGTIAATFDEADTTLQARKKSHKNAK